MSKFKLKDENNNWIELAKAASLSNYQDKFPDGGNSKYLHTGNGSLEWGDITSNFYYYDENEPDNNLIWVSNDDPSKLIVDAPEGCTITAEKDGVVVPLEWVSSTEKYEANLPSYGTWTINCTKGTKEVEKEINIYSPRTTKSKVMGILI